MLKKKPRLNRFTNSNKKRFRKCIARLFRNFPMLKNKRKNKDKKKKKSKKNSNKSLMTSKLKEPRKPKKKETC